MLRYLMFQLCFCFCFFPGKLDPAVIDGVVVLGLPLGPEVLLGAGGGEGLVVLGGSEEGGDVDGGLAGTAVLEVKGTLLILLLLNSLGPGELACEREKKVRVCYLSQ